MRKLLLCSSLTAEAADCSFGSALSHFLSWTAELLPASSAELPRGGAKTKQPLQFVIFQAHKTVQTPPWLLARYPKLGVTSVPQLLPTSSHPETLMFWVTSEIRQKKSHENIPFHVWLQNLEFSHQGWDQHIRSANAPHAFKTQSASPMSSSWRQIPDFLLF